MMLCSASLTMISKAETMNMEQWHSSAKLHCSGYFSNPECSTPTGKLHCIHYMWLFSDRKKQKRKSKNHYCYFHQTCQHFIMASQDIKMYHFIPDYWITAELLVLFPFCFGFNNWIRRFKSGSHYGPVRINILCSVFERVLMVQLLHCWPDMEPTCTEGNILDNSNRMLGGCLANCNRFC